MYDYDVTVIGGGPAGLAAALAASEEGARVLLIERERRLGGILKQCIHDGFGLLTFGEKLSGPEYCERYIDQVLDSGVSYLLLTFVTEIKKKDDGFTIHYVNRQGAGHIGTASIVLATGCRERTAKQVFIHGTRPAGIFTAGTAQHYVNLMGEMPAGRCVILGSGDIGLIMARRLTLEGAEVLGVYEAKPTPSGLTRNIHQCLLDFDIPLHLSHTVTRVFGDERLSAVEVARVDEKMRPIPGTEEVIECDSLIVSVGLIPENELAESLGVSMNPATKGPVCDQRYMTSVEGIYCAGNALHVNDLVDYVTESALEAGKNSAVESLARARGKAAARRWIPVEAGQNISYVVPSRLDLSSPTDQLVMYFRVTEELKKVRLTVSVGENLILQKQYAAVRPPEMERVQADFSGCGLEEGQKVTVCLEKI